MVLLEKGSCGQAVLGRLEPSDGDRIGKFFYTLSPETVYRRFLSPVARPDIMKRSLLDGDRGRQQAVVAVVDGDIVGVANYARHKRSAELADLAVVVTDVWQRHGIGTRLLGALADAATRAGIERFSVVMLPDNEAAKRLLRRLAPGLRLHFDGGVLEGTVPLKAA